MEALPTGAIHVVRCGSRDGESGKARNMTRYATDKQIRSLLAKGWSANRIIKELHLRKQVGLKRIRELSGRPIQKGKVTVTGERKPVRVITKEADAFTGALLRTGYPVAFIKKLVKTKHPNATYKMIARSIEHHKEDADLVKERKDYQKFYRKQGKKWLDNHLDGKFYRETNKHWIPDYSWNEPGYTSLADAEEHEV